MAKTKITTSAASKKPVRDKVTKTPNKKKASTVTVSKIPKEPKITVVKKTTKNPAITVTKVPKTPTRTQQSRKAKTIEENPVIKKKAPAKKTPKPPVKKATKQSKKTPIEEEESNKIGDIEIPIEPINDTNTQKSVKKSKTKPQKEDVDTSGKDDEMSTEESKSEEFGSFSSSGICKTGDK